MVKINKDLVMKENVVVECKTQEEMDQLIDWMETELEYKDWHKYRTGYYYKDYYVYVNGDTLKYKGDNTCKVLQFQDTLIKDEDPTEQVDLDNIPGTIISWEDLETKAKHTIDIPFDEDLTRMAYVLKHFLITQGYYGIKELTIKTDNNIISSEDLYN